MVQPVSVCTGHIAQRFASCLTFIAALFHSRLLTPCCLHLVQDVQALAICCCKAASLLHHAGVVHRDFRLDNIVQLGKQHYMLVDLEAVAAADAGALPPGFSFRAWGNNVLDSHNCFTTMSDMYLVGMLLAEVFTTSGIASSAAARGFVDKLVCKHLRAAAAMSDPWLAYSV